MLTQLAHAAMRTKGTYLSALSHRLAAWRGKQRAIIAVARQSCGVSFTCSPARNPPANEGPTILMIGGGTTPWSDSPGGLNTSGIECNWNQWQHPWHAKLSRQPFRLRL